MGLLLSGCGMINNNASSSTCASGTVEIQVTDASLRRVCGCAESAQTYTSGSNLQCTITAGTYVFFNFISIQNQHTIGVSTIGTTATFSQNSTQSTQTGVIFINRTGTFTFSDINTGIGGTFIVN